MLERMRTTIGRLLELVIGSPSATDTEMSRTLGIDPEPLRDRLRDLKRRGILVGPSHEGGDATWKSWFPTVADALAAAQRSGLRAATPVRLYRSRYDRWVNG